MGLLRELITLGIGLKETEDYRVGLELKFRSQDFIKNGESQSRKVVKEAMTLKLRDEEKYSRELNGEKHEWRKKFRELYGEKSWKTRKIIKYLRGEASGIKMEYKMKYEEKLEHLRKKYVENNEEKVKKMTEGIEEFIDAKVFNHNEFEKIEAETYEITIVGDVALTDEEKSILKLHPKFAIPAKLDEENLEFEFELGVAKLRMEIGREEAEKLSTEDGEILDDEITPEEEEIMEEEEARSRQTYDPENRVYDARKTRVTDLKENSRVTLPKPLNAKHEAEIELRRSLYSKTYKSFMEQNCDKNGDQDSNLTEMENKGLKSIKKRIADGELLVIKTDKSSKFAIISREKYEEL